MDAPGIGMRPTNDDWFRNPFAGPMVEASSVTTQQPTPLQAPSQETNPFSRPAPKAQPVNESKPVSTFDRTWVDREAALTAREEKIERQKRELEEKEKDLEKQAARLRHGGSEEPNWPPFPGWCFPPFEPWIYHSISTDIPPDQQGNMRAMFGLWNWHCFCYLANLLAACAGLACADCIDTGTSLGIAIAFFVLGIPLSFKMWYRMLYLGMKKNRAVNFMLFFFIFGFQIFTNVFFVLGFPGTGACGLFAALQTLDRSNITLAVFYFVSTACWGLAIAFSLVMLFRIHTYYRGTDYTIDKVQSEVTAGLAANEYVQRGTRHVISNGMGGQ